MDKQDFEVAYRQMAQDQAREEEALEWSEALMEDIQGGAQSCEGWESSQG